MTLRPQPGRANSSAAQRTSRLGLDSPQRRMWAVVLLAPGLMAAAGCGPSIDNPSAQAAAAPTSQPLTTTTAPTAATALTAATVLTATTALPVTKPSTTPLSPSSTSKDAGDASEASPNADADDRTNVRTDEVSVLSDQPGDGTAARSADCLALDVDLEIADTGAPVRGGDDLPMVIATDDTQVIPGIIQGTADMRVGGSRRLLIPPELAYGPSGWGNGAIQPGDSLVADVSVRWAGDAPSWSRDEARVAARSGEGHLDLDTPGAGGVGQRLTANGRATALVASVHLDSGSVIKSNWPECKAQTLYLASSRHADWMVDELVGMRPGDSRMVFARDDGSAQQQSEPDAWLVTMVDVVG